MPIFLVRHGDAVAASGLDEHRALSVRGREETRALGRALVARIGAFDRVIASPLVRAVQTAELIAIAIGFEGMVEIEPAMEPEGDPDASTVRLEGIVGRVIAVTHEPIVRAIGSRLTGRAAFPPFRTSTGCWIEDGRPAFYLGPHDAP